MDSLLKVHPKSKGKGGQSWKGGRARTMPGKIKRKEPSFSHKHDAEGGAERGDFLTA